MSLKGDKYENAEEVRFRLEGTVVLYDGAPVYITRVRVPEGHAEDEDDIARVYFQPLPYTGDRVPPTRKYLSSKKFNLATPKMGFLNYQGRVLYVSRSPVRQNQQGLSSGNVLISNIDGTRCRDVDFSMLVRDQGFADMLSGRFPDFRQAGELLDDPNVTSVAISTQFAVTIDNDLDALFLFNKAVKCGLAFKGDNVFRVSNKFRFLHEAMREVAIPFAA